MWEKPSAEADTTKSQPDGMSTTAATASVGTQYEEMTATYPTPGTSDQKEVAASAPEPDNNNNNDNNDSCQICKREGLNHLQWVGCEHRVRKTKCNHWVHLKCLGISVKNFTKNQGLFRFFCPKHNNTD